IPATTSASTEVGEIFSAAGATFIRLGELTMQLYPETDGSPVGSRWTEPEEDLNRLSTLIKDCTVVQLKAAAKRKAYEDSRVPLPCPATNSPKKGPRKSPPRSGREAPHDLPGRPGKKLKVALLEDQACILATALPAVNQFARGEEIKSPAQRHWATSAIEEGPHVTIKNELGEWGWRLILTGRGYAAVKKNGKIK
uniref:Uncharacterized protein n=1 Tax=Geospiza parvula TaxID=87175 RepID=A0A8U8BE74_GEOPR